MRNFRACFAVVLFVLAALATGCSSESDLLYSDEPLTVAQAKARVLELAYKYGLTVELNDSVLARRVADGTFDLADEEEMFRDFSAVLGVYQNLSSDSNSVTLNTGKERRLMKTRLSETPEREEEMDSISKGEKSGRGEYSSLKIDAKVAWEYNPKGGTGRVRVIGLSIPDECVYKDKYNVSDRSLIYTFTGLNKRPTYSFEIVCMRKGDADKSNSVSNVLFTVLGDDAQMSFTGKRLDQ